MFDQVDEDLRQVGVDESVASRHDQVREDVAEATDGLDGGVEGGLADEDLVNLCHDGDALVSSLLNFFIRR